MARPVVRVVFALLVLATIAAFFVTQQLKSEFPLVIRFAAKPKQFSPNGDGVRDRSQVGFDLSEPATVDLLDHGPRGQRGAPDRGRPRARRRHEAPLPLGRSRRRGQPAARRRLPHARGASRRGPRGRLFQARPDRPRAAPGAAGERRAGCDRAARAGPEPRGDAALRGPAQQRPRVPRVPHRRRGQAARGAALPRRRADRHLARRGGHRPRGHGPGPRRRLRLQRLRARPRGQPRRGAGRDPARPGRAARHRRGGAQLHAERTARRGGGGLAGGAHRRAVRPLHRLRALALRRSGADPARRAHRGALPRERAARHEDRRVPGAREVRAPPRRVAAGGGRPAAVEAGGQPAAPAGGAARDLLAGPQPGGRRPRRLRRHAPGRAAPSSSTGPSAVAGCRPASPPRWRRCCATSNASGSPTT